MSLSSFVLTLVILNCKLGKISSSFLLDDYNNYCNRTYPNGTVPPSPNNMDEDTFNSQPCFCDEECSIYGDCCEDASALMTSKNFDTSGNMYKCEKITQVNHSVYVIKKCPSTWSDDNTRSLCMKEVENEKYHYIIDLPVYSNVSGYLYANTFCSVCNNDFLNASFLTLETYCDTKNCTHEITNKKSSYIAGKLEWIMTNNKTLKAFIVDQRFNNVRKCHEIVDKCAINWADDSVSHLCRNYNYYKRGCFDKIYKNNHCIKCNYEMCYSSESESEIPNIKVDDFPGQFNLILDFTLTSIDQQCFHSDEIYNEFLDACVPLLCGKNYDLIDRKCQLKTELQNKSGNNSIYSCIKIAVTKNELEIFSNGTIYRNKTQTIYNESEYEISDNDTYLVCVNDDNNNRGNFVVRKFSLLQIFLSTVCLSISIICLAAHIIIQCVMKNHSNLPGKILLSLSISLFIGQLLFLVGTNRTGNENVCFTIGVLIHFFYLSVFFWMNVMAIDFCRTLTLSHHRTWKKKTFYFYAAYSWLFPLIIVITSVTIDLINPTSNLRPRYGRDVCWISDRFALFLFFALPIGILLIANVILFIISSCIIYKTVKANNSSIKSHERRRFHVYVKLVFMLGLTWIIGFAAAFTNLDPLWYGFIILNASQGTFIFIIFTLKRKVLRYLCQKLTRKRRSIRTSTSKRTEVTISLK